MKEHTQQKLAKAEKHLRAARELVRKLNPESTETCDGTQERAEELSHAYQNYEHEANRAVARLAKLAREAESLRTNTDESIRKIQQLAYRDQKTGLANVHLLREFLRSLASARSDDSDVLVALVDLDSFRVINEVLGSERGDWLLAEVAERLQTLVGPSDAVGRTREDEFMLILSNVVSRSAQERFAKLATDIKRVLAAPFTIDEQKFEITASIGGSSFPTLANSTDELVHQAEAALSYVKQQGRDQWHFYSRKLKTHLQRHAILELQMQRALQADRFYLEYLPVFRLNQNRSQRSLVGVEALIRWNHSVEGILLPEDFLPVAERSGFIVDLGYWMLKEICRQIKRWQAQGLETVVFVNLTGRQLLEVDMVGQTQDLVRTAGVDPFKLIFEFRDNFATLNEEHVEEATRALCQAGFSIALKDFGDSFYSLSRLSRSRYLKLSPRILKEDRKLCRQALKVADTLDAITIGVNIDQPEEIEFLRTLGCEFGQGSLLSKALPGYQIAECLAPAPSDKTAFHQQAK